MELQNFIAWLPEINEDHETFYIVLQARKKYMPELSSSDTVEIRRFTTNKERMLEKLHQLECPIGCYKTKKGQVVNDEGLVVYITTNPRDTKAATSATVKDLVDHMQKGWGDPNYRFNPARWADRQVHKCKSRTCHVHFDIDFPAEISREERLVNIRKSMHWLLGSYATTIFETRGGCHVLIEPSKVISNDKNWYVEVQNYFGDECDQGGDLMLPIPGCTQGGFTPRRYT